MDDYIEGLRQSYHGEMVAEGFYRRLALGQPEGYRRAALLAHRRRGGHDPTTAGTLRRRAWHYPHP